jgi:hypothetical protein
MQLAVWISFGIGFHFQFCLKFILKFIFKFVWNSFWISSIKILHSNHLHHHDASSSAVCAYNHKDRSNDRQVHGPMEDAPLQTGIVVPAIVGVSLMVCGTISTMSVVVVALVVGCWQHLVVEETTRMRAPRPWGLLTRSPNPQKFVT